MGPDCGGAACIVNQSQVTVSRFTFWRRADPGGRPRPAKAFQAPIETVPVPHVPFSPSCSLIRSVADHPKARRIEHPQRRWLISRGAEFRCRDVVSRYKGWACVASESTSPTSASYTPTFTLTFKPVLTLQHAFRRTRYLQAQERSLRNLPR